MKSTPNHKRYIHGLGARVAARRKATRTSLQVTATAAAMSIPRLRDAECFSLASNETLQKLAFIGVDLSGLVVAEKDPGDE